MHAQIIYLKSDGVHQAVLLSTRSYSSWKWTFQYETEASVGLLSSLSAGQFHLWRQSPFWAPTPVRSRLHSSLSPALLLQPRITRIYDVFLGTMSSHLVLGFFHWSLLWNVPLRTSFGILSSSCSMIRLSQSSNFNIAHGIQNFVQILNFTIPSRTPASFILYWALNSSWYRPAKCT